MEDNVVLSVLVLVSTTSRTTNHEESTSARFELGASLCLFITKGMKTKAKLFLRFYFKIVFSWLFDEIEDHNKTEYGFYQLFLILTKMEVS